MDLLLSSFVCDFWWWSSLFPMFLSSTRSPDGKTWPEIQTHSSRTQWNDSGLFQSCYGQPGGNQHGRTLAAFIYLRHLLLGTVPVIQWWQFRTVVRKWLPLSNSGHTLGIGHIKSHAEFHASICNGFWDTWLIGTSADSADHPTSSLYWSMWVLGDLENNSTNGAVKWRQIMDNFWTLQDAETARLYRYAPVSGTW